MPNWCECDLWLSGKPDDLQIAIEGMKSIDIYKVASDPNAPKEIIEMIAKATKDGKLEQLNENFSERQAIDFNSILPYPYECWSMVGPLGSGLDGYNAGGGYNWCNKNWGTKWNASEVVGPETSGKIIKYSFRTAWSPPIPVIQAWSMKFNKVRFTLNYYEASMCFQGEITCFGGKIISQKHEEYHGDRGG